MAEVKIVLKRINERGHICFEAPREPELQEALRNILRTCQDKYNDYSCADGKFVRLWCAEQ